MYNDCIIIINLISAINPKSRGYIDNCQCSLRLDEEDFFKMIFERVALTIRLARLPLVITGAFAYALGYLLAITRGTSFDLQKCLFGYLIFVLAHMSVSFSNDYFDIEADRYTTQTGLSGGSGVLLNHAEMRRFAILLSILLIVISVMTSAAFTVLYSYPITFFIFTIFGGLLGFFYTAPPLKLAYRGLGEISSVLGIGFVMTGMGYFVAFGMLDIWFFFMCIPLMCYALFFILTVEMPDIEGDRIAKKMNFLVIRGVKAGAYPSFFSTIAGSVIMTLLAYYGILGPALNLNRLAFLSLIPLVSAAAGLKVDVNDQSKLVRQAKLNLTALSLFLLMANLSLILQNFAAI